VSHNPSLLQINTRTWLNERGAALNRSATLDDVPDVALERIERDGFEWVWLLGIWQTGEAGRYISLHQPEWQREYRELLGEFSDDDVAGSPFAIQSYAVNREFGGPLALERFRERLAKQGVRLMLDFVPNHTAIDHPWVRSNPEYYIHGTEDDLRHAPANYRRIDGPVFAHGRDPYFPGWPDTLQLNYRHRGLREAQLAELRSIARQCDGVRCDMAMLVLPDVIARTWGERSRCFDGSSPVDESFWPWAIQSVRRERPEFVFMAEAYWDMEWTLQQQGFDFTYDKKLYDRLRGRDADAIRGHLRADAQYQQHSARFLENHDEPRAAAVFEPRTEQAAAVLALLAPGLHFVHEGQTTGRRFRTSNHLRRRAVEPVDRELESFYRRLLACMQRKDVRDGNWKLADAQPAWQGNNTCGQFVSYTWERDGQRTLVAVNYGPQEGQCYLRLPYSDLAGKTVELHDCVNPNFAYTRQGDDLAREGLYLDVPPWRAHVFNVQTTASRVGAA
jgi:glycosidase